MTREEALAETTRQLGNARNTLKTSKNKAVLTATANKIDYLVAVQKSLCGPTREMVEGMFPGCALCNWGGLDYVGVDSDGIYLSKPSKNEKFRFCPVCGKPLTDEAVDIVMRRLEAVKDGKGD